ncbi:hypothetical protein SAY87_030346 [Trapa incisa]|uniref:Uncharacterized protein n=1 Tax=Trapa incisa TaxID=236973 RepID=A0AAN7KRP0_9MYRT|nr:hypothetical protein SAY87_030346 [Trapa incisa]
MSLRRGRREVGAGGRSFRGDPSGEIPGGTRTDNGSGDGEGGHCSALQHGFTLRTNVVEGSGGIYLWGANGLELVAEGVKPYSPCVRALGYYTP